MKLSTLTAALLLLLVLTACGSAPERFQGSVRDLVPPQAGGFKLKGEVKPVPILPPGQYQKDALRPTEGAVAQYEAPDGSQLALQVVNYPSRDDALASLKAMRENVEKLETGAKVEQSPKRDGNGREVGQRLVVDNGGHGASRVVWTNGSLLYLIAGEKLDSLLEFEKNLPS